MADVADQRIVEDEREAGAEQPSATGSHLPEDAPGDARGFG